MSRKKKNDGRIQKMQRRIQKRYGEKIGRKIKKGIDKRFLQVYHPTRKGKGVFERKFSEASFTFTNENI